MNQQTQTLIQTGTTVEIRSVDTDELRRIKIVPHLCLVSRNGFTRSIFTNESEEQTPPLIDEVIEISDQSPMAKALITGDHQVGDVVTVRGNGGPFRWEIRRIVEQNGGAVPQLNEKPCPSS